MQQFIENNWLSILSILIGILVAYVFYRLQRKDSASASAERKKHASAELLDVIESYIINKQRLSEQVIDNLIHASERDHLVALRPSCTATSLLQDVALRLQRSRHLDIPQKSEYSEKIEQLIQEIREHRAPLRLEDLDEQLSGQLAQLQAMLPAEHKAEFERILSSLASLVRLQREASLRIETTKERMAVVATALIGVTAALSTTLIGSKLFDTLGSPSVSSLFGKLLPAMGVMLAAVVLLQALSTVLRIKRRTKDAQPRDGKTDA